MIAINGQDRHVLGYLQDFLFPPEHRQPHFTDQGVTSLVDQHKEHVAGHEFDHALSPLERKALEA